MPEDIWLEVTPPLWQAKRGQPCDWCDGFIYPGQRAAKAYNPARHLGTDHGRHGPGIWLCQTCVDAFELTPRSEWKDPDAGDQGTLL